MAHKVTSSVHAADTKYITRLIKHVVLPSQYKKPTVSPPPNTLFGIKSKQPVKYPKAYPRFKQVMPRKYYRTKRRSRAATVIQRRFRKRRSYKKKAFRKHRGGGRLNHASLGLNIPQRLFMKMRIARTFTDATTAISLQKTFQVNNLRDPWADGTEQPMYYDAFINLYQKYLVRAATTTIVISNLQNSAVTPANVTAFGTHHRASQVVTAALPINYDAMYELGGRIKKKHLPMMRYFGAGTPATDVYVHAERDYYKKLTLSNTTKDVFKVRNLLDVKDDLAGTGSVSPVQKWYHSVRFMHDDSAAHAFNLKYRVTITFNVEFYQKILSKGIDA